MKLLTQVETLKLILIKFTEYLDCNISFEKRCRRNNSLQNCDMNSSESKSVGLVKKELHALNQIKIIFEIFESPPEIHSEKGR